MKLNDLNIKYISEFISKALSAIIKDETTLSWNSNVQADIKNLLALTLNDLALAITPLNDKLDFITFQNSPDIYDAFETIIQNSELTVETLYGNSRNFIEKTTLTSKLMVLTFIKHYHESLIDMVFEHFADQMISGNSQTLTDAQDIAMRLHSILSHRIYYVIK